MDRPGARSLLVVPNTQSRSTSPESTRSDDDQPPAYDTHSTTPEFAFTTQDALTKTWNGKGEHASGEEVVVAVESIGLQSDEVYERTMGPWSAALRRILTRNLVWESNVIAAMQVGYPR